MPKPGSVFTALSLAAALAAAPCGGAAANDDEARTVALRDIWKPPPAGAAAPARSARLLYVDYADTPEAQIPFWRLNGYRGVTLLHTSAQGSHRPARVVVVERAGESDETETTYRDYLIYNASNLLALKGVAVGDAERYVGVAPIMTASAIEWTNWPGRSHAKTEILVFAGVGDAAPAFNKRFPCKSSEQGGGTDRRTFAKPIETCLRRSLDKAFSEPALRALIAGG